MLNPPFGRMACFQNPLPIVPIGAAFPFFNPQKTIPRTERVKYFIAPVAVCNRHGMTSAPVARGLCVRCLHWYRIALFLCPADLLEKRGRNESGLGRAAVAEASYAADLRIQRYIQENAQKRCCSRRIPNRETVFI